MPGIPNYLILLVLMLHLTYVQKKARVLKPDKEEDAEIRTENKPKKTLVLNTGSSQARFFSIKVIFVVLGFLLPRSTT